MRTRAEGGADDAGRLRGLWIGDSDPATWRPWPGAPSRPATDEHGFEQLGWSVSLAGFNEDLLSARRDSRPPVTLRVKLARP